MTIKEVAERWLAEIAPDLTPRTLYACRRLLRECVWPVTTGTSRWLTPQLFERILDQNRQRYARSTIADLRTLLTEMMRWALAKGIWCDWSGIAIQPGHSRIFVKPPRRAHRPAAAKAVRVPAKRRTSGGMRIQTAARLWLAEIEPRLDTRTFRQYRSLVRHHIEPIFGPQRNLRDFSLPRMLAMIDQARGAYAPTTVTNIKATICRIARWAAAKGMPAAGVEPAAYRLRIDCSSS